MATPGEESTPTSGETLSAAEPAVLAGRAGDPFRGSVLLALFIAVGLIAFGYVWMTLHRHHAEELAGARSAAHDEITHWIEHGYFASYGLLVPTLGEKVIYRSETGGFLISGFVVEKIWVSFTGKYGWRLLALHNELVALLAAAMLALLAYRIARRFGVAPLHAFVLGVAVEMVQFTFPESLGLYWDMSAMAYWLIPAIGFLLIEELALDGHRTRFLTMLQAVAVFAMTYLEYICGTMFIASYVAVIFLLRDERPPVKHLAMMLLLPYVAAFGIYGAQLMGARHERVRTGAKIYGSSFLYRSGLDGDSMFYGDHLDIAFGRDIVRAGRGGNHQFFFRWEGLFFAGVIAVIAALVAYVRGSAPRIVIVTLMTLIGTYLLYAAVFSQAAVLHPYHFDLLLAAPLILALFGIVPGVVELRTKYSGTIVLIALFGAVWLSMFQLRIYALCYPLPQPAASIIGTTTETATETATETMTRH